MMKQFSHKNWVSIVIYHVMNQIKMEAIVIVDEIVVVFDGVQGHHFHRISGML